MSHPAFSDSIESSKFLRSSVAAIVFSLTAFSSANASDTVTLYAVDYPPYIMINEKDRSVSGMDIDVIREAFASQGQQVSFKNLPWNRIVKLMKLGKIAGTVSCSIREQRLKYMLFSDELSQVGRVVFSKNDLDTSDIQNLEDLKKYSVTTVEGWGMQTQLMKMQIPHTTAPDLESAIKSVAYRGVDAMYMAEFPTLYYSKQLGLKGKFKVTKLKNEPPLPLHLCLSKSYPNSQDLLKSFNKGLQQMKADGRYESIQAQYLY